MSAPVKESGEYPYFSALEALLTKLGPEGVRVSRLEPFPEGVLVRRGRRDVLLLRAGLTYEQVERVAARALTALGEEPSPSFEERAVHRRPR